MVDLFTRDTPAALALAVDAVLTRSQRELKQAAHALRGTASNIGATQVAALCLELEVGAGVLELTRELELVNQLGDELSRATSALHAFLALLPPTSKAY